MAKLNFYLERRKSRDGLTKLTKLPVILYFSYEGKRFQYYTGERTDLKLWNSEKQRLVDEAEESRQINAFLNHLSKQVWEIYREAKRSGIRPGNEYFRNMMKRNSSRSSPDFFEVFMQFIEESSSNWSITTFRKVKTSYTHLRRFSEWSGFSIEFKRINAVFFDEYISYFATQLEHSNVTIHKNIMILKWFLNWASRRKINTNFYYRSYEFPWSHEYKIHSADMRLQFDELLNFYTYDFEEKKLSEVRDIFCFMCFTGIKLSELNTLKKTSFSGDVLKINIPGKNEIRSVPVNNYSGNILKKYIQTETPGKSIFPAYTHVTMNRLLKTAAKMAGIDRQIEISFHTGKMKRQMKIRKWQAMSTKVAVNTFIINAFHLKIPARVIMDFTGHKEPASMKKYEMEFARIGKEEMRKFNSIAL